MPANAEPSPFRSTAAWSDNHEAVLCWTFSGESAGASFAVPVVTVLTLRGHQIVTDDDYYSLPH